MKDESATERTERERDRQKEHRCRNDDNSGVWQERYVEKKVRKNIMVKI